MGNFITRTFYGAIFAAILIAGIVIHPFAFYTIFTAISILSILEFYKLVQKANFFPQNYSGVIGTILMFSACFIYTYQGSLIGFYPLAIFMVLIPIFELYRKKENPFTNIAFTLFGLFYIGIPFSLLNFMVFPFGDHQFHWKILMAVILMIWANDTGAYIVGVNIGKHRLFERISPKKSWEGSIGGAVITLLLAWLISMYSNDLTLIEWLILGAIIVVFGSLGDLVESLLKRSIQVKDSGTIIPGHGGLLDRFDALLLVSPMVFIFLQVIKEYFH